METARNPEPDKNSSIQATPVPETSTPSEPTVKDVAPVRNSPAAANGAADADIAPSIQDASANPMNNAPEARIEESISAPNAAATGSPATNDAIPDASAVHASVSSESRAPTLGCSPSAVFEPGRHCPSGSESCYATLRRSLRAPPANR